MSQRLLALLTTGLFFSSPAPLLAQVDSEGRQSARQSAPSSAAPAPAMGTVPGIYYDPSGELSPSLSQLQPTEESGAFSVPNQYQLEVLEELGYDPSRAWASNATPDQILKIGDLLQNQYFEGIGEVTLREIAQQSGMDIDRIPLDQIALVREMTIGELYEAFPEIRNLPLRDIPLLAQTLTQAVQLPQQVGGIAIELGTQRALEELTAIDPTLGQIPLGTIVGGDWQGALSQAQAETAKIVATELLKEYPALANVPVADVLRGNWQGVKSQVINAAQRALVEELASIPALQGIPIEQLIQGDWGETLTVLQQQGLEELAKSLPQLAKLPIDQAFPIVNDILVGDWQSIAQQALDKGLDLAAEELFKAIPELKDLPLGALPIDNLSIASLPGLVDRPLATLPNIANEYVGKLPGLSEIPLSQLPLDFALSILAGDLFGRLDIAYAGEVETPVENVLTGGTKDQEFEPEPCTEERCPHFELDNIDGGGPPGTLSGKAWVEGEAHMVEGGKRFLRFINGGEERTGISPWGTDSHVKLSLEDIKEGSGEDPSTAQIWANFQFCIDVIFLGEQCSPHFISVPTPWKVQEGGLVIVASFGDPPSLLRDQQEQIASQGEALFGDQECVPATTASVNPPTESPAKVAPGGNDATQENLQRYLARIAVGESAGGSNIGPNPQTGAYGEYQFTPGSRQLLMKQYPDFDPWSTDKRVRDRAAIKWIELYGQERGVDIIGTIQKGDFGMADKVLGQHVYNSSGKIVKWGQFTSLPGGAEEHQMWRNAANLVKYGPKNGGTGTTLVASGTPCPPGTVAGGGTSGGVEGNGIATGQLSNPAPGYPITSGFGPRSSPCSGCSSYHPAVDIGTPPNTPIQSADGGTVIGAEWWDGYGNTVVVDHGNGVKTRYSHLNSIEVRASQKVSQGQRIALSGATGYGTGPHLDFGVYKYQGSNWMTPKAAAIDPRTVINFR